MPQYTHSLAAEAKTLRFFERGIEEIIAEGADVPARGAYCLEQVMDFRSDRFRGAGRDDVELVQPADHCEPPGDLPGKVPRFLVAPDTSKKLFEMTGLPLMHGYGQAVRLAPVQGAQ